MTKNMLGAQKAPDLPRRVVKGCYRRGRGSLLHSLSKDPDCNSLRYYTYSLKYNMRTQYLGRNTVDVMNEREVTLECCSNFVCVNKLYAFAHRF